MREPLKINSGYNLFSKEGNKKFYITSIIGFGATCIVYEAYYLDDFDLRHQVRLKECYPINDCKEQRNSDERIQWKSELIKESVFELFEKVYRRHLHMQLQYDFVNVTSKIIDCLYEGNNTKYIVMECDNGQSFDKAENLTIYNKLKILRALANTVNKYHEIGWLHLDLKPENFMIIPETAELVKIFDFDSMVSINAIRENRITALSYSKDWAAPEVKQGRVSKIGPESDVYSIGAILYYMIFGERIGMNSKLQYGKYFEKKIKPHDEISPALMKRMNEFLMNTLAASKVKRYNNMHIVIEKLNEMIHLADPSNVYLKTCLPSQTQYYFGRNQEMFLAKEILDSGKLLVVSGIGGIGKSEFALRYANLNSNTYDCVVFGRCGSRKLKDFLCDSNIFSLSNIERECYDQETIYNQIKKLLTKDILLIIDDFNDFEDECLPEILQTDAKVVITTRVNVEDYFSKDVTICLDCMETETLKNIFYHYYERQCEVNSDVYVGKIIERFDNYTLLIPILAKQMKASSYTPENMWEVIKEKGIGTPFSERIIGNKDQIVCKDYLYNHVKNIFDLSQIDNQRMSIIMALALMGDFVVEKNLLARWCSVDYEAAEELKETFQRKIDCTAINDLIELGWVNYDGKLNNVYLHDVIREVILYELKPGYINSYIFLKNILYTLKEIIENHEGHEEEIYTEEQVRWYTILGSHIILNLDETELSNELYVIEVLDVIYRYYKEKVIDIASFIYIKQVEKEKKSINLKLKINEWICEWHINRITRSCFRVFLDRKKDNIENISLLKILKIAIFDADSVEDWGEVSEYSSKEQYFGHLYRFLYWFNLEKPTFCKEYIDAFLEEPNIDEIIKCLKHMIQYAGEEKYMCYLENLEKLVQEKEIKKISNKREDMEDNNENHDDFRHKVKKKILNTIEELQKKVAENSNKTKRFACYLFCTLFRVEQMMKSEKNPYYKQINPTIYFLNDKSWECFKMEVYEKNFNICDLDYKMLEMSELGVAIRDLLLYFDLSNEKEMFLDFFVEMDIKKDLVLKIMKDNWIWYNVRSFNMCTLIWEIQSSCTELRGFVCCTNFWDEFLLQLMRMGYFREFLHFLNQYCEILKEDIISGSLMSRDTHMVQYLIYSDLDLLALKLLIDIIRLIEENEDREIEKSTVQMYYEMGIDLAEKTDNEEIYYQFKERLRTFSRIKVGYNNKSVRFSPNNVNTICILNDFIKDIETAESLLDYENIYERLKKDKYLDDSKEILKGAIEEKESMVGVVLNKKLIRPGIMGNEDALEYNLKLEHEKENIHDQITSISEVCLQAIILNRGKILERYIKKYIDLQDSLIQNRLDALHIMSYMVLPEILLKNGQEMYAIDIYMQFNSKIINYDIGQYGDVEKLFMLPYLIKMCEALRESDLTDVDMERCEMQKRTYTDLYKKVLNML